MLTTLREAKLRGARIVAINPLREAGLIRFQHPQKVEDLFEGVALADLYLQVNVGGDIPLLKALMKLIIAAGAVDREFIAEHTVGFEGASGEPGKGVAAGAHRRQRRARERRARSRRRSRSNRAPRSAAGRWGSPSIATAYTTCKRS